jgi:hypothetical protein
VDESRITIKFECPLCGSEDIDLPDDFSDDSIATCANPNCGAQFGRWVDIKERAKRVVAEVAFPLRTGPF